MAEEKMGIKVEKGEELDPKLGGGTALLSAKPQVEGQWPYPAIVICPWCGSRLRVIADTAYYKWFTCCVCGGVFRF